MLIRKFMCGLALLCPALFLSPTFNSRAAAGANKTAGNAARFSQYANLPLRFEAHQDRFLARGDGYSIRLNGSEAVFQFRVPSKEPLSETKRQQETVVLKMSLVGAHPLQRTAGQELLPTVSNYFPGNDPAQWRTNVANFARVKVEQVYPGIDLVWHGNQRRLEYDFQLAPGARAEQIKLAFTGARAVGLDRDGALILRTGEAEARMLKPVAWQEVNGERREVACLYRLAGKQVGFRLGAYDKSLPLVIDPVLVYSTFLGGSGFDDARAVAVDAAGNAYITGSTSSPDFPGSSPIQANRSAGNDVFVLKLNPAGNTVVYATWLGGNGSEDAEAIAVDTAGNAVVTGTTSSTNFPTKDPLQATRKDGAEGYVTKLNATGTALVYSTYLGGSGTDAPSGVALDAVGNAYLTGYTESLDFPLMNALQPIRQSSPLYISNNAGANWTATDNSLNAAVVYEPAIDPTNPAVVYATTNRGIYKTVNSGATWAGVGGEFQFPPFQLLIDPTAPMTLYALGSRIFKSTNGGESFNLLTNSFSPFSPAVATTSPATLYAVTSNGVLKSTDGGATWTPVSIRIGSDEVTGIRSFAVDPVTPSTLYAGGNQAAYKSTDGGATWQTVNTGLTPGGGFQVGNLFIGRSNPAVLVTLVEVSSTYRLYRTTNGGSSWNSIDIPNVFLPSVGFSPQPDVAIDPTDANIIYVGTPSDGVYKSTDGGASWNAINNGLNNTTITALAIPNSQPMTIYAGTASGSARAFVTKINPTGSALVYSTYLGGSNGDYGSDIAVDADGNVYVAGTTNSKDFPTRNAYQAALKGDFDAFVTKINPAGSALVWSTFVGGGKRDGVSGLAVNRAGNAFITGTTTSTDFPVVGAIQAMNRSIVPADSDAFVTRLAADGRTLDYSTYLGGRENENMRTDIGVDAAGNAYVTGTTPSTDFPVVNAVQTQRGGDAQRFSEDAFVAKINADGSALLFSTFLGGSQGENGSGIAVDAVGNAYVVGGTDSSDFPLTTGALRTTNRPPDGFIAKFGISADLAVTIRDEPDPVQVNGTLTYRVVVTNNGADTAVNATVAIALPAGPTVVSVNGTLGNCTGSGQLTCTLGNLAATAGATITVVLKPTATGDITLQAAAGSATFDAVSANNTASQTTKVSALPSIFGRVATSDGQGVSGVTLSLSPQIRAATTDAVGNYQFGELAAGANYAVVPTKPGFTFFPVNREFNNLTADQRADFTAVQCSFTVAPQSTVFTATGGAGSVTVTANNPACAWTARGTVPWIRLTAGSVGTGSGSAIFTVEPTTTARRGEIVIAGQVVSVRQEFEACPQVEFQSLPIILSDGISTFVTPRFVVADFNGDGRGDPVVQGFLERGITAAFSRASGYDTKNFVSGKPVSALAAGDFNRDGKPDLALALPDRVMILLNTSAAGAGNFAEPAEVVIDQALGDIFTGDFNDDGNLDIALNSAGGVPPMDQNILVLLGNGTGGFGAPITTRFRRQLPDGARPATGDFNGDGRLDVAVINHQNEVLILRGNGAGGFEVLPGIAGSGTAQQVPYQIASGDFNGDGRADIVVLRPSTDPLGRSIGIHLSAAAGGFDAPRNRTLLNDGWIGGLLTFDSDGNGRPEILILNRNGVEVVATGADGTPAVPTGYTTGPVRRAADPGGPLTFALGDFNGDRRMDVFVPVAAGAPPDLATPTAFAVLVANAGGEFATPRSFPLVTQGATPTGSVANAVADFNGDRISDLAVRVQRGTSTELLIRYGDGQGGFRTQTSIPLTTAATLIGSDYNRDGRADIVVLEVASGLLTYYLGTAGNNFLPTAPVSVGINSRLVAEGDFNSDGNQDFLLSSAGNLKLLAGNGNAGFTETAATLPVELANTAFTPGDFNGDGKLDLLTQPTSATPNVPSLLRTLFGDGQGRFTPAAEQAVFMLQPPVRVADFNNDGKSDIVFTTGAQAQGLPSPILIAWSQGNGRFGTEEGIVRQGVFLNAPELVSFSIIDLNGDGRLDLAATTRVTGQALLFIAQNDSQFRPAISLPASANSLPFAGDFNGDGANDLLSATPVGVGNATVFLNRGTCAAASSLVMTSAAGFNRLRIAGESIASAFGANLANEAVAATGTPLPTTLGGSSLRIRDSAGREFDAPLFFVSPGQINLLIPRGPANGPAVVTVRRGGNVAATGVIEIVAVNPGLLAADATGTGYAAAVALRVKADGSQVFEPVVQFNAAQNRFNPVPITVNNPGEQVFLLLFGTGIRNRSSLSNVGLLIGGEPATVDYAGDQGGFAGLDQLNVRLSPNLAGKGDVNLDLTVDGKAANTLRVRIR